jgi:hypothetical protein
MPVRENREADTTRVKVLTLSKLQASRITERRYVPKTARRTRRRSFAAALVCVLAALSVATAALAATGVIDFGEVYNSIFRNDKAAPYVVTSDNIEEIANSGELDIKLISAFTSDKNAYVQLEITGENIPEELFFFVHDEEYLAFSELTALPLTDEAPVITRIDKNTVRAELRLTQHYFTYYAFVKDPEKEQLVGVVMFDTVSSSSVPDDANAMVFTGQWRYEFDVIDDLHGEMRDVYMTDIGGHEGAVDYSATEVCIYVFDLSENGGFDFPYDSENAVILRLKDGSTVTARFASIEYWDDPSRVGGALTYSIEFTNPAEVESISFCGEVLERVERTYEGA